MVRTLSIVCLLLVTAELTGAEHAVSLTVTEPSGIARKSWPVTSGVPLARGQLRFDRNCALVDESGKQIPLQTEILSRWDDGSIRWLLLDFQIALKARQTKKVTLRYGPKVKRVELPTDYYRTLVTNRPRPGDPISPAFDTGPMRVVFLAKNFGLLDRVYLDRDGNGKFTKDERVTKAASFVLTDDDGKEYRSDLSVAKWTIEQHGPIRACIRFSGKHTDKQGKTMYQYLVRIHAFRGLPHLKIDYTFINDDQSELMSKIRSIRFECQTTNPSKQLIVNGKPSRSPQELFQIDDQQFRLANKVKQGKALGWTAVGDQARGMAIGVREFWQNWPKALATKPGQVQVGICPEFRKGLYDGKPLKEEVKRFYYLRNGLYKFKIGLARTHTMWATFYSGEPKLGSLRKFFQATEKPLLAQFTPQYIQSTKTILHFRPAAPKKYFGYDAWFSKAFDRHLTDQLKKQENGMLNHGDWYDYVKFGGGWGNQEYDSAHCFFTQYLRTGDRRYFDRAKQGAQHCMDVDVLHVINKHIRGLDHHGQPQPGHMYTHCVGHTGGYYEGAKIGAPIWYQRGMLQNSGHLWIGGLCFDYLLTGNRRALEVAKLVADRVASENLNGYSDHIRTVGWPLNLLVTAYETTGDERYLRGATRQWKLLKHHLDLRKGWVVMLAYGHCNAISTGKRCRGNVSYMEGLMLSSLARYHNITKDPEVMQGLVVGLDQIIRECWDNRTKMFYSTACKHHQRQHLAKGGPTIFLSSLAFVYTIERTGNERHKRIYKEAFDAAMGQARQMIKDKNPQAQAGYMSRWLHFTSSGLSDWLGPAK